MRLYLDTNILVFYLYNRDELSTDVKASLFDYSNTLLTSTVCVHELIHLVQIGKVQAMERGRHKSIDPLTVVDAVRDAGLGIEQVSEKHHSVFASLPLYDDHRDPADRLIIAQAIADRVALVSSDRKFSRYGRHGLHFVYNER